MPNKTVSKKKTSNYRRDKKPDLNSRRRNINNLSKTEKSSFSERFQTLLHKLDTWLNMLCIFLILISIVFYFSLKNSVQNELSAWCSNLNELLAGKTALFSIFFTIFISLWILCRYSARIPKITWEKFFFFSGFYLYILILIQHFSRDENNAVLPQNGGGILAAQFDNFLRTSIGSIGTLLILFFLACIFILIIGHYLSKWFVYLGPEPDDTHEAQKFRKPIVSLNHIASSVNQLFFNAKTFFSSKRTNNTENVLQTNPELKTDTETMSDLDPDTQTEKWENPEHLDFNKSESLETTDQKIFKQKKDDSHPEKNIETIPNIHQKNKNESLHTEVLSTKSKVNIENKNNKVNADTISKSQTLILDDESDKNNVDNQKWLLPQIAEILDEPSPGKKELLPDDPEIQAQAQLIEKRLKKLRAPAKVVNIQCGPTFTQYGIEPGFIISNGKPVKVRISKIESLIKDIEMALAVEHITIEAPIPGKTYIGIQVPNKVRVSVPLREVIVNSNLEKKAKSGLWIALGKDINGEVFDADITQMPHLIVAGSTGTGKSVCLNSILTSLLLFNTPDQLRLVLIDPKRVELTGYNGIPHLITPVITNPEDSYNILQWAIKEMDLRNQKFAEKGVRNIQEYNQTFKEFPLPYIIILIDELANLMSAAKAEIEDSLIVLAQRARAMGIHLIVATQRPSSDVITGTIKANFPSAIAFAMSTHEDSMTVIDRAGAEKLCGLGDMYFLSGHERGLKRLQGVYVSDEEINRLTNYWKGKPKKVPEGQDSIQNDDNDSSEVLAGIPRMNQGISQIPLFSEKEIQAKQDEDSRLNDAIEIVRQNRKASANMLVSQMGIGFSRANHLLAIMEKKGIIGPANQNRAIPRKVLDYGDHEEDSTDDSDNSDNPDIPDRGTEQDNEDKVS